MSVGVASGGSCQAQSSPVRNVRSPCVFSRLSRCGRVRKFAPADESRRATAARTSSPAPVTAEHPRWGGGGVGSGRRDEIATLEVMQRSLHAALGETRTVDEHAQADHGGARATARLPPQVQVHDQRRRSAIVTDEIWHERVQHVGVDTEAFGGFHLGNEYYSSSCTSCGIARLARAGVPRYGPASAREQT